MEVSPRHEICLIIVTTLAIFEPQSVNLAAMVPGKRTALITGGASGMGLAVAEELNRLGWNIAIVDLNAQQANQALPKLASSSIFCRANVVKYQEQLEAFEKARATFGSIDFVFANAGIIGKADFYNEADAWPPEPPSLAVQDICLTGVIYTCHLAMHFMRRNEVPGGTIVMTASGEHCV